MTLKYVDCKIHIKLIQSRKYIVEGEDMKINFKGTVIILVIAILVVGTMAITNWKPSTKTVELKDSELNSKIVTGAPIKDTGITRYDIDTKRYTGYILEIKDPKRIKLGYSKNLGKDGEKTSDIAKDNNAVAAINGGVFYEKGSGFPAGILISNEKVMNDNNNLKSYVVGNNQDGKLLVGKYNVEELRNLKVVDAVSCITGILVDGVGQISGDRDYGFQPRTAIGQKKDGTIIFLVLDGRQIDKVGATLKEVQDIMLEHNGYNAVNLDGGSSTTMYYNGSVINKPCSADGERKIPTAFYVTP